ncbi:Kelch motif-containing protein [Actinacidiphila alni]|uniref:Kelch motif-containing protein n=2 Tax=Actinacidiphila alni TaxID=380248 RepID=A0A1I1X7I8_9ACTN|nr:Kelch motif-containing protein [Actinacidiphila alni]
MDSVADAHGGRIYTGFSDAGLLSFDPEATSNELASFNPDTGTRKAPALATDRRQAPGHGIIDGKLYVAGGWAPDGTLGTRTEIQDIAADSWTTGADLPAAYAGAGSAVLAGKLYLVGGCADACGTVDVSGYDPAADIWSAAAPYPEPSSWTFCAGLDGRLYRAGCATNAGGAF